MTSITCIILHVFLSNYGLEVKWECFGASCYYMPTLRTAVRKAKADAVCEAMGAHVVAVEAEEENGLILHLVYELCKPVFSIKLKCILPYCILEITICSFCSGVISYIK